MLTYLHRKIGTNITYAGFVNEPKMGPFCVSFPQLRNFRTRDTETKKVRKLPKIAWLNKAVCEHRCEKSEIFATLKTPVFATFAKATNAITIRLLRC